MLASALIALALAIDEDVLAERLAADQKKHEQELSAAASAKVREATAREDFPAAVAALRALLPELRSDKAQKERVTACIAELSEVAAARAKVKNPDEQSRLAYFRVLQAKGRCDDTREALVHRHALDLLERSPKAMEKLRGRQPYVVRATSPDGTWNPPPEAPVIEKAFRELGLKVAGEGPTHLELRVDVRDLGETVPGTGWYGASATATLAMKGPGGPVLTLGPRTANGLQIDPTQARLKAALLVGNVLAEELLVRFVDEYVK
jgi:hypothetical protein